MPGLSRFPTSLLLLARLADVMEQHQEELATIEALDAGAVYTLALKTHVGMSIQTFRYFAGWCDKIQVGSHLPWMHSHVCSGLLGTRKVVPCQAHCPTATSAVG